MALQKFLGARRQDVAGHEQNALAQRVLPLHQRRVNHLVIDSLHPQVANQQVVGFQFRLAHPGLAFQQHIHAHALIAQGIFLAFHSLSRREAVARGLVPAVAGGLSAFVAGNCNTNRDPPSGGLTSFSVPPCCRTKPITIAKPKPVPAPLLWW
jgi:hypothetical protein